MERSICVSFACALRNVNAKQSAGVTLHAVRLLRSCTCGFLIFESRILARNNVLTAGRKAKADQAARAGDRHQAQALFASVCQLDPTDVEAWTKLSLVEKGLGNYPQAERLARRALMLAPKLGYGHFALGQALHGQEQRTEAIASYRAAIHQMPDFSDAHYLLGLALHEQGLTSDAVRSLEQALRLRPAYPEALAEMGAVCIEQGRVEAGLEFLHRAAALRPVDAVILGNISHALRLQGENQAALESFHRALRLAPDNVDLIASCAAFLEKAGKADEARALLDRGLQLAPDHVQSNLVAAQLDRRAQRLQQAAERLEGLLVPTLALGQHADIELELGQIYDQMGDAARAFPRMVEGNRKKAMVALGRDGVASLAYLERLVRIRHLATSALAGALHVQIESCNTTMEQTAAPAFLIGFPRSGTTLMEQILDSHPRVQSMEEKPPVSLMVSRALDMLDEQCCTLAELDERQLTELRQLYWTEAERYVRVQSGHLLIDKMPLNTIGVPVIARVFPNAKFIVAIRHPCDVSLSCLMQNFAVNAGMTHFFTMDDTVHLYAQVMGAWLHYVQLLPLQYHPIRYEDLIENVPRESRKLLDFLGLPWDDAVLSHTEHARQRGAINTPSYHQVVQPVYQRSKYRWMKYEHHLTEVLPVLQPFIEQFGYA